MPRIARAVAPGYPHHIVQRGNNRDKVFFARKDRQRYLSLLSQYAEKWGCTVLAYCLMGNHVHLLTKPEETESLYKMMQGVTLCYTQYVNRSYGRTGRLWESRYHSCIVDDERYLWAVAIYIEQNPVRAKMVKRAEDFPYSSAGAHISGAVDDVLTEELFEAGDRKEYKRLVRAVIPKAEINDIRYHTKTGRPLGDETFMMAIQKKLGRRLIPGLPGRPKKRKQ